MERVKVAETQLDGGATTGYSQFPLLNYAYLI
jgi:hypothetical protein